MRGKVFLVGAGPGDPDLLTIKALRLLQTADVVLHDDLVGPEILDLISPAAEVQNVGKRCGRKAIRQEEINFLMVARAATGSRVVRLKSGDPLIFGRAGEEMEALQKSNVEYEIVPGITTALGAAAAACIPLTHRQKSSTLVLTAGHRAPGSPDEAWRAFASSQTTMVVYMPGSGYGEISRRLAGAGFAAETPCAVISKATTPQQRIHLTTVAELIHSPNLLSPTILVVGNIVKTVDYDLMAKAGPPGLREELTPTFAPESERSI